VRDEGEFVCMDMQLQARRDRDGDLRGIGDWHTHPMGGSRPSEADLRCQATRSPGGTASTSGRQWTTLNRGGGLGPCVQSAPNPPARRRDAATVTPGVTLCAAALLAEKEALAVLGSDGVRFGVAVRRYVLAVDVAEPARVAWAVADRPIRDVFANGMSGVSPSLKAWEQAEAQAESARLTLAVPTVEAVNRTRGHVTD
jgi:hypothetical protein